MKYWKVYLKTSKIWEWRPSFFNSQKKIKFKATYHFLKLEKSRKMNKPEFQLYYLEY